MLLLDVLCIGYACWDITATLDHYPQADEKTTAQYLRQEGGGPAANASIAIARLGGRSAFAGHISKDALGQAHATQLRQEGVDLSCLARSEAETPLSMIWVSPQGKRALVNHRPDHPNLPAPSWSEYACILADGHEAAWTCDALQHLPDTPWVLDAGSLHPGTETLLEKKPTYLVSSRKFAQAISGSDKPSDWLSCLRQYSDHTAVTVGDRGCYYQSTSGLAHLPPHPVKAVDSNAAGDAFHGAFAYAIARQESWSSALRFANKYAALSCAKQGGHGSFPYQQDLNSPTDRKILDR